MEDKSKAKIQKQIVICGGGNLGHVIAAFAAHRGYNVQLFTRHPEQWSDNITIHTPDGSSFIGHLSRISNRPEEVIPQADIVLLCLPGYGIADTLHAIRPFLRPQTAVGSVVSSTGFFFEALQILPVSTPLFGFQRVPFIARLEDYGHSAHLLGYKPSLSMAVERGEKSGERLAKEIGEILNTPVRLLGSHYEVSLTNSNPLLHTSRLYSMWNDWHEGVTYPIRSMFYYDWTDEASQLLIDMDEEFFRLLAVLPVTPGAIPSILDYYESTDAASLTHKLHSIEAFKEIPSPMKAVGNAFIPDFQSRYFTEDFPYGLAIIHRLMHEHHIDCPHINKVYEWGKTMLTINN
ncbi:MAG: NAD/NADP octopine/nopaline dehydrogenase family protein [Prevotella sp.]|nr:NAD/NADP octopine/nopaline dehydrogenase family protein [Prevotella sp.]